MEGLIDEEIFGMFYEKKLQKRIKDMLSRRVMKIKLIAGLIKNISLYKKTYYLDLDSQNKNKIIKVELDCILM